jgi:hypothetical protein
MEATMKLTNAAIGLAAVGAGLVVARMLTRHRDLEAAQEPPSPEQLIGEPQSHLSAIDAAQAFRSGQERH